ncbi:hypothetical protein [Pedobacter sp. L105]|uniref:hypothetical protein n=1 Tax=Pedobacter sp. L105 TaxID=1641871 RepID=UPI00131C27EC|nr:hypothetical protein [Pedobacter sp. L105]
MKKAKYQLIDVPIEFKVACTIYKLKISEVLQIFIDHVTLYDTICPYYHEGFSEATRTISAFVIARKRKFRESKALLHCRTVAVGCIKGVIELARKEKGKDQVKRKKSMFYVDSLFKIMERTYVPSDVLYLDENTTLQLSKNFSVLCELHNCYPKEYLEHFMGRISLADCHARKGLKITNDNLAMGLFMMIANGFARDSSEKLHLTETELDFYERMEEMRLELYIVRNLTERTDILRDFYLSHYQNMNP